MVIMKPSSYEVIIREAYAAQYADPITLRQGDTVRVQRADTEVHEWLWCRGPDGRMGSTAGAPPVTTQRRCDRNFRLRAKNLRCRLERGARYFRHSNGWAFVELEGRRVGWLAPVALWTLLNI